MSAARRTRPPATNADPVTAGSMRAMTYERYGGPEVLELREVEKPALADDGVLVRVHASSVNPLDWHYLTGLPYLARLSAGLRKPKSPILGTDFAGVVEAVGRDRNDVQPGDEVFGARSGAFAEYVCARKSIVRKPPDVTFGEAAAVPVAAVTALQALRDKGQVQPGQRVLVNGASGGVGTFAVQLAKAFGAEVTGVCSTRNVELVRSLGADRVIDYTRDDFTRSGERYDLMLDIPGNRSWSELKEVLTDSATYVMVGGPKDNRFVASFGVAIRRRLLGVPGSRRVVAPFLAAISKPPLAVLAELLEAGKIKPAIDRIFDLPELPEALAYVGRGHSRAKNVVVVREGPP